MAKRLVYVDLFSGCGGLSWGLMNAGWKGLFAIEKDPMAFSTLKSNLFDTRQHFDWPRWLPVCAHDINRTLRVHKTELRKLAGRVDLVAGGPPCQGFSVVGRRNEKDKRNKLVKSYIAFIKLVRPKAIFFENVRGFTMEFVKNGTGINYSDYVTKELNKLGYAVHSEIVNFADYGVPQRRFRYILVGSLNGHAKSFFSILKKRRKLFLKEKALPLSLTVSQAISDLERRHGEIPSPDSKNFFAGRYSLPKNRYQKFMRAEYKWKRPDSHRFPNHRPNIAKRFKYILAKAPRNKQLSCELKSKYNLKKRSVTPLAANLVCPTLTTLPDDFIHYLEPRVLTVREYARVQSFPDNFLIKGQYTSGGQRRKNEVPRYTQIGNAIPPLFTEFAGIALKRIRKYGKRKV